MNENFQRTNFEEHLFRAFALISRNIHSETEEIIYHCAMILEKSLKPFCCSPPQPRKSFYLYAGKDTNPGIPFPTS